MGEKRSIGVLCYNLDPSIVDLLNRLTERMENSRLKAYPLVAKDTSGFDILFPYRSTTSKGRFLTLKGTVPESQLLSVHLSTVCDLMRESDVVVLFGILAIPALLSAFLARLLRKPVITIVQAMEPDMERRRKWYVRRLKAIVLRLARIHITQTEATERTLHDVYGIPRNLFFSAPYDGGGRSFKELMERQRAEGRDSARNAYRIPRDAVIFTFVGTLIYLKGVDILVDAFARLASTRNDVYLFIIGPDGRTGGQRTVLQERVGRLGLSERVIFTGPRSREELIAFYESSDVFVLPTRKDVWPKVLVEASLVGLPIITTPASAAANTLVRDGVNGFIVPVDDVAALANAMGSTGNVGVREKMGACSREIVEKFLNPDHEADRIHDALQGILCS